MLRRISAICAMALIMRPIAAEQKPKPVPAEKHVLTEEEKEIIKNRDILENLDLLQNLEKLRFMDFFKVEEAPVENKASGKPVTKKDGKKKNE
jgi:hypothetical protein